MKKMCTNFERSIADGNFDFLTRVTERPYFASTRRQVVRDSGCRFAGRRTSTSRLRLWLSHTARGWRALFQGALPVCTATGPHLRLILSQLEVRTRHGTTVLCRPRIVPPRPSNSEAPVMASKPKLFAQSGRRPGDGRNFPLHLRDAMPCRTHLAY